MPNHIKNKLELFGTSEDIKELVAAFSTFHDRKPREAYDERLIFQNPVTGAFGWLDTNTNEFEQRGQTKVIGVPEGFEQEFDEAFIHFPDFDKIIPMPKILNIESGSLGEMAHQLLFGTVKDKYFPISFEEQQKRFAAFDVDKQREAVELAIQYEDNLKKYGHTTWYGWCIEYWGTKWNSYSCEKESDNVYTFETAWSGVPKLIEKMSQQFPKVKILYKYSDEDTGSNCGVGEYQGGEVSFNKLLSGSNEAYELAFELRPSRKEYYKMIDGEYKYSEDEE
jgi:hypothetical protein